MTMAKWDRWRFRSGYRRTQGAWALGQVDGRGVLGGSLRGTRVRGGHGSKRCRAEVLDRYRRWWRQ